MYFACLAIIESLSPVQATWTSAAFTVVTSSPPRRRDKDGADLPSAPSAYLGVCRGRARGATDRLPHLLLEVTLSEKRHQDVVGDEGGRDAPPRRPVPEPVEP